MSNFPKKPQALLRVTFDDVADLTRRGMRHVDEATELRDRFAKTGHVSYEATVGTFWVLRRPMEKARQEQALKLLATGLEATKRAMLDVLFGDEDAMRRGKALFDATTEFLAATRAADSDQAQARLLAELPETMDASEESPSGADAAAVPEVLREIDHAAGADSAGPETGGGAASGAAG